MPADAALSVIVKNTFITVEEVYECAVRRRASVPASMQLAVFLSGGSQDGTTTQSEGSVSGEEDAAVSTWSGSPTASTRSGSSANDQSSRAGWLRSAKEVEPSMPLGVRGAVTKAGRSICWATEAGEARGKVVSPEFMIELPGLGPLPFQMALYAKARGCGATSHRTRPGRGRLELSSRVAHPTSMSKFIFHLRIDTSEDVLQTRGPFKHGFAERNGCGVRRWDYSSSAAKSGKMLFVHLEVEQTP
jgi:hypothetical protein